MQWQKQTVRCPVCYTLGPDRFPALQGPVGLFTDSHVAVLARSIYTIKAQHVCWISRQALSEHPRRTNSVCEPSPSFPQQTQQRIQIKPGQGTSSLCLEHTSEWNPRCFIVEIIWTQIQSNRSAPISESFLRTNTSL